MAPAGRTHNIGQQTHKAGEMLRSLVQAGTMAGVCQLG
jgi:hypothetical protein